MKKFKIMKDHEPFRSGSTQLELTELNEMITDLNKKAAIGRRNRRGQTLRQFQYAVSANPTARDVEDLVRRRFERELPLAQAAMVRFVQTMRAKSIKVIWFAAGKTDVTRMLKDCHMWAERIPTEIANSQSELGAYFSGAGNILS